MIEKLALATGQEEQSVAHQAIDLAQAHAHRPQRAPRTSATICSMRAARSSMRAWAIGCPLISRLRRGALDHPTPVYLSGVALITFIVVLGGVLYARAAGANPWQEVMVGLLLLIPALTVSVSLINWIITLVIPPRVLPKMDFEDNIPAEYKTLVVIPSLLSSAAEVKSLLKQVELHSCAVRTRICTLRCSPICPTRLQPPGPDADPLVAQATAGIYALNEKYHRETSGPFYLFHRDPKWNPHEERWMGWERKRGKLHQLNRLLRGGAKTAFSVQTGDLEVLREIKYVITLDADTLMPREAAHRLVATLAHPLNRAEFDPRSGRRHRRVHVAATRHRDHVHQRQSLALYAHLCRRYRPGFIHARGVERLSRFVWRRQLRRQGHL